MGIGPDITHALSAAATNHIVADFTSNPAVAAFAIRM
jgi:hypothetical protein